MTRTFLPMIFLATGLSILLSACAGDTNPVRDVAVAVGLSTPPLEPKDFVRQTRAQTKDYLPVGVSAPPRLSPAKSAADVRTMEAELDALRARQEAEAANAKAAASFPAPVAPKPPGP